MANSIVTRRVLVHDDILLSWPKGVAVYQHPTLKDTAITQCGFDLTPGSFLGVTAGKLISKSSHAAIIVDGVAEAIVQSAPKSQGMPFRRLYEPVYWSKQRSFRGEVHGCHEGLLHFVDVPGENDVAVGHYIQGLTADTAKIILQPNAIMLPQYTDEKKLLNKQAVHEIEITGDRGATKDLILKPGVSESTTLDYVRLGQMVKEGFPVSKWNILSAINYGKGLSEDDIPSFLLSPGPIQDFISEHTTPFEDDDETKRKTELEDIMNRKKDLLPELAEKYFSFFQTIGSTDTQTKRLQLFIQICQEFQFQGGSTPHNKFPQKRVRDILNKIKFFSVTKAKELTGRRRKRKEEARTQLGNGVAPANRR